MHASQDGHAAVNVVVDLHARLTLDGTQHPADVLDESALERDREREEQRVEGCAVESFAQEAPGRDHDDAVPRPEALEGPCHEAAGLLPHPALKHEHLHAAGPQRIGEVRDVAGPLRQDEAVATLTHRRRDVIADLAGPFRVIDQAPEHRLDGWSSHLADVPGRRGGYVCRGLNDKHPSEPVRVRAARTVGIGHSTLQA